MLVPAPIEQLLVGIKDASSIRGILCWAHKVEGDSQMVTKALFSVVEECRKRS